MSTGPDLQVTITTAADTTGAKQAAAAVGEVASAATRASGQTVDANRAASRSANELGESFERGAAAGRVIAEVAQGNVMAVGQLGASIKVIGTLLKTNLIGTLFTLGAVAAQVLIPIIRGFTETKKKVEETAVSFKSATEEAKKLRDAKFDALKKQLDEVNERAERMVGLFRQALQLQGKQDEAETAAQIAAIENDPNLTPLQKIERTAALQQGATQRKRTREDADRAEVEAGARTALQTAQKTANERAAERDEQKARVDAIDRDRVERQKLLNAENAKLAAAQAELSAMRTDENADPRELQRAMKTVKELTDTVEALQTRQDIATSPEAKARFEEQQRILAEREAAWKSSASEVETKRKTFEDVRGDNYLAGVNSDGSVRPDSPLAKTRAAEDRSFAQSIVARRREAIAQQPAAPNGAALQAEADEIARRIAADKDELGRRPGMSNDPRNATLVERIEANEAAYRAKSDEVIQAFNSYSSAMQNGMTGLTSAITQQTQGMAQINGSVKQVSGEVQGVTATVNAERVKSQRLHEAQAMHMSLTNQ